MNKVLALAILFCPPCLALEFNEFLFSYFKNSTNLANHKLTLNKARHNYLGQAQLNRLSYSLKPYYQKIDYIIPGTIDYQLKSKIVENTLTYTSPWATNIQISGNHFLSDKSTQDGEQKNYSLSIMLSQPIVRNIFGHMDRKLRDSCFHTLQASQIDHGQIMIQECATASLLYLQSYHQQEKLLIAAKQDQEANKVWQQSQANYKRHLINKIDYLGANSDHLASQLNRLKYDTSYQQSLAELKKFYPKNQIEKLFSPEKILNNMTSPTKTQKLSPRIKQLQQLLESTEDYYRHIRSKTSLDISLFAGAGRQKNDVAQTTVGDSRNDYIIAGLTMELPIINGNNSTEKANALTEKLIAENNLKEAQKNYAKDLFDIQQNLNLLKNAISIIEQKVSLYKKQSYEAKRKMLSGKIDFKDYILYRDLYANEQMNLLDQKYLLYQNLFSFFELNGTLPNFCQDNL